MLTLLQSDLDMLYLIIILMKSILMKSIPYVSLPTDLIRRMEAVIPPHKRSMFIRNLIEPAVEKIENNFYWFDLSDPTDPKLRRGRPGAPDSVWVTPCDSCDS